jgi:hypothetical protein
MAWFLTFAACLASPAVLAYTLAGLCAVGMLNAEDTAICVSVQTAVAADVARPAVERTTMSCPVRYASTGPIN